MPLYEEWYEEQLAKGVRFDNISIHTFGQRVADAALAKLITNQTKEEENKSVPAKKELKIKIHSCLQCGGLLGIYRPCTFTFRNLNDEWIDPDCPLPDLEPS